MSRASTKHPSPPAKMKRASTAKLYNVWIEVEEHDLATDEYRTCEGLPFAALACFASEEEAFAFAERVQKENAQ